MEYYTLKTGEPCITTAIYKNRVIDKLFVDEFLGLNEFGDSTIKIKTKFNTTIANGYLRVGRIYISVLDIKL